jgi:hypothetical protein
MLAAAFEPEVISPLANDFLQIIHATSLFAPAAFPPTMTLDCLTKGYRARELKKGTRRLSISTLSTVYSGLSKVACPCRIIA